MNCRSLHCKAALLAAACLMMAALSCAAESAKVIIKPNARDTAKSDVYVQQSAKGNPVKFITLSNVSTCFHPAEYHNGHLYILKRIGQPSSKSKSNWIDELWRYTKDGKGTKLWASKGIAFSVRDDEGIVAVLFAPKSDGTGSNSLFLLARDGKQLKVFSNVSLAAKDLDIVKWEDKNLWVRDQEAVEIYGFICVDTRSMTTKRYDISIMDTDFDFNTKSLLLAYSDLPIMFDTIDDAEFKAKKTPVKLYVYDLKTKKQSLVARSVAKAFNPKWTGSKTLSYDNPVGRGTVKKEL